MEPDHKRGSEGSSRNSDSAIKKARVTDGKKEEELVLRLDVDLNVSIMDGENDVDVAGGCTQTGLGIDLNNPIREVIDISSDDDDEEGEGDKMLSENCSLGHDLRLGIDGDGDGGSSAGGERRYTREEKGKGKADDFLSLSLASGISPEDLKFYLNSNNADVIPDADEIYDANEIDEVGVHNAMELLASLALEQAEQQRLMIRENEQKERAERIEKARHFAHFTPKDDSYYWYERKYKKVQNPATEADQKKLENLSDLNSAELKVLIDRNTKRSPEQLIKWSPRPTFRPRHVPSLLDLCVNVLAKNADAISSFENVPDWLKRRLTNLLCDTHKMNIHIVELLFKGSPTEVRIKNGSWMTEQELVDVLQKSDLQNLRVLQLNFCGQCSFDDIIRNYLARSPNSLACLGILSLKGAARLCDDTLNPLLVSAPLLQSINLSQCTLLTWAGIKILADSLKTTLKELYIDDCPAIDAMRSLSSMLKFEHMEVLSVDGIQTVNDEFVTRITTVCGRNLKELNLANCVRLTDRCLHAIGKFCHGLRSLNVSYLHNLTDLGMCYLADGCKSLESLNITRAGFSDAVVAAFLETSGGALKELSLNHVRKVSFNSAFSLAKFSRNLISLDLSWCRQVTDEALGFITDNCSSLRLLKIFGCTQITDSFIHGHGNSQLHIVGRNGRNPISLLDKIMVLEPVEVLLRHSALETPNNG